MKKKKFVTDTIDILQFGKPGLGSMKVLKLSSSYEKTYSIGTKIKQSQIYKL
tara:strand:+ start:603 stop:758 length:156 start_codon:yes stop_codon:yes gene_type:complete